MDTSALTTVVPATGLGLLIVTLVGYVLRQIPVDRADYGKAITAERQRTAAAEARVTEALERETRAQLQVDEERKARRAAEAAAAVAESTAAAQQVMLQWYAAERGHLLRYLPPGEPPGVIPDTPPQEGNQP